MNGTPDVFRYYATGDDAGIPNKTIWLAEAASSNLTNKVQNKFLVGVFVFTVPNAAAEIIPETGQLAIKPFHRVRVTGLDTLDQQAPRRAAVA